MSDNKLIRRFFKGVFHLRPPRPRYDTTWDVEVVFTHLESWWPLESIPLSRLTKKLVTLLALVAQRVQSQSFISLPHIR